MMQGWQKADPPPLRKLPVEANIPQLLSKVGQLPTSNKLDIAIGDLALIAFYFLLVSASIQSKAPAITQNKQCNSPSRMLPSSNVTQLELYNN
jgi:hypothetical protein